MQYQASLYYYVVRWGLFAAVFAVEDMTQAAEDAA